MMGMPGRGVECSAKKAMTALSGSAGAMGFLPNCAYPRRIFLKARMTRIVDHETGRSRRLFLDGKSRPIWPYRALKLDRDEVIDRDQDGQQPQPKPEAPANQLLLDRQQRLDFRRMDFVLEIR
jgi:hypothetical protein